MKKIILMAFAVMLSLSASAQIIASNTIIHHKSSGYNRLSASYKSFKVSDELTMNGVSLDWTKGFVLSFSTPIYLETGVGVMYASKSKELEDYDISTDNSYLGVTVPIDVTYRYSVGEAVKIDPFAGIYLRGNILGKSTLNYSRLEEEDNWYDDYDCKRFNVGWQVGVGVEYKLLYLGISYGGDFNDFAEDTKTSTFAVTLGVTL